MKKNGTATSLPNPPLPPPHLQSFSLGSSFECMVNEEVKAVVSRIRRGGQGGAGGASAAGGGGCGGGGRNWLKDHSDPGHDRPDCGHHEDDEEGAGEDDPKGDERGGAAAATEEGDGQGEEDPSCDVVEGGCRHSDLADSGGEELELGEDTCEDREGGDGEGDADKDEEGVEAVVGGGGECGTTEEEDNADSREEGEDDCLLGQPRHQLLGVIARQPVRRCRVHIQRFKSSSSPWNKETLIKGGDRRDGDWRDGFIRQGRGGVEFTRSTEVGFLGRVWDEGDGSRSDGTGTGKRKGPRAK